MRTNLLHQDAQRHRPLCSTPQLSARVRGSFFCREMDMGELTINSTQILTVIAGAAGLVTAIWHAAMYVGKLSVRVQRHQDRLNNHDDRLKGHDEELKFIKGISR